MRHRPLPTHRRGWCFSDHPCHAQSQSRIGRERRSETNLSSSRQYTTSAIPPVQGHWVCTGHSMVTVVMATPPAACGLLPELLVPAIIQVVIAFAARSSAAP